METIPTPRTDEDCGHSWQFTDCTEVIEADKCRVIERELHVAKQALEQFKDCDLHEGNCASVEVASRRIRRVAIEALGKINTLSA